MPCVWCWCCAEASVAVVRTVHQNKAPAGVPTGRGLPVGTRVLIWS